ncbi:quinone-dependent dihydroorotate dehydrogenase [soil metagenome]
MSSYGLVRPALFALDAERAHDLALGAAALLTRIGLSRLVGPGPLPGAACEVMGLRLPNPIGLAAGLDKNGDAIDALAAMGFGFIELGTVTPKPQAGNPRPRMFRLAADRAVINRLGFNNGGVDLLVRNVERSNHHEAGGIIGLNIGKNATTPIEQAVDDYLHCLDRVYRLASYIVINISSPNTANLRQLQGADEIDRLLAAIDQRRSQLADQHGKRVPIAVKIAPDLDEAQLDAIASAILRHGIDGVTATNTTLSRAGLTDAQRDETGGLSGAPLTAMSSAIVSALRERLGDRIAIIGVGGIMSGADARSRLAAGAAAVQLYSGLVYAGPELVADCVDATRTR